MDESKSTGERLLTGYFDRITVEHLHRYALACRIGSGLDVLDIACGEGYGSHLLASAGRTVVGVDIDPQIVQHAAEKYSRVNLKYMVGSADDIPLATASIDVVVSFETLEHHDRHEEMYAEIKRVLRPGGALIISTPDKHFFTDLTRHRNAYHIKELYFEEFLALNRRYFSNVATYSQKIVLGSLILSQAAQSGFTLHAGDHFNLSERSNFADPTYHLCVASDSALCDLGLSFFDGGQLLSKMESKLDDQDDEIGSLKSRLKSHENVIADLQASWAYRIGHGLLLPIKLILGRRT